MNKRMKRTLLYALGLLTLLVAGCQIVSVFPFYEARDVVTDDALVGHWGITNEDYGFWIAKGEANSYRFCATNQDGRIDESVLHLFRLADTLFLDQQIIRSEGNEQTIRPHKVFKVLQIQPVLKAADLKEEWLKAELVKEPKMLALAPGGWAPSLGVTNNADVILTADTKALRKLLLQCKGNTNAFGELIECRRLPATQ